MKITRPSELVNLTTRKGAVFDLAPEWRAVRPAVAGFRTGDEVAELRALLMAGYPLKTAEVAPPLMTDRGYRLAAAGRAVTWIYPVLTRHDTGVLATIAGLLIGFIVAITTGSTLLAIILGLSGLAIGLAAAVSIAIRNATLRPQWIVHELSTSETSLVMATRAAVRNIKASRAYREGYLDQHRAMVDLDAAAVAVTRRVVEMSQVRRRVEALSGPVRPEADRAMRAVQDSLTAQVRALQNYNQHVHELDSHLRDAESSAAALEVFEAIRGLLASTVEDELEGERLSDAVKVTRATSDAITQTVNEAASQVYELLGTADPPLPAITRPSKQPVPS